MCHNLTGMEMSPDSMPDSLKKEDDDQILPLKDSDKKLKKQRRYQEWAENDPENFDQVS